MDNEAKEVAKAESRKPVKTEFEGEKTVPGKYYVPRTDIVETEKNLVVCMDVPGVKRENINVMLENNILEVDAKIDFSPYENLNPVYTEYNVGHYTRKFTVSNTIDTEKIDANLADGVLVLTLPKAPEAQPRKIQIK
ncbi:putative first small heat shock protein [Candidatus Kuenenia stuttgartiensis]|uniref:Putative first small heat shock protein n=1 Tax=Kuenenia stuttgartiensis TaxID=174633 RepID=Q1Q6Q2_KUEST|nr:Hsp20/alpha crystallin family protein [Candidatus Kuenenia stuttgartiensis]QII12944.1 putative first small heat shock protein [Candidatus Kuenenia stuttgartiensis]CAJ73248.1 similar to first small heat shock protein [Candidatus Kuenenia stuttgartiensis]